MNTLQTKAVSVEAALKLAKPYVGNLRKKDPGMRPILKCALVTEEHVIATDSHRLIRIRHNESITEPYLHHFKESYKNYIGILTARNFPQTERLFPQKSYAISSGPVDVKEMYEAAAGAQVVTSKNTKVLKELFEDEVIREVVRVTDSRLYVVDKLEHHPETSGYKCDLNQLIPITEETHFDGNYFKQIFKTFKQAREKTADMYFFGPKRQTYLVAGPIEIILLPCRKN